MRIRQLSVACALLWAATTAAAVPAVCPTLVAMIDGTYTQYVQETLREDLGPGAFETLGEGFGGSVYRYTPADRSRAPVVVKIYTEAAALEKDFAALNALRSALERHPIAGLRVAAVKRGRLPHTMEVENVYGRDLKGRIGEAEVGSAQRNELVGEEARLIGGLKSVLTEEFSDVDLTDDGPSRVKGTAADRRSHAKVAFWFKGDNILVSESPPKGLRNYVVIDPY